MQRHRSDKVDSGVLIITGASSGVGKSAALKLAKLGYQLVLVGLEPEATAAVAAETKAPYHIADFTDLQQVKTLAKTLIERYPRIDTLVNNAGAIFGHRRLTENGFEVTLQVNYLAPYLLTRLLLPALIESRARVIQTASVSARLFANLDIDDLQLESNYSPNRAYGNSKLADILFTRELDRRYRESGVSTVSFHPGNLATGFGQNTTSWMKYMFQTPLGKLFLKPADEGGDALTWMVQGEPAVDWQPGEYYEDRVPALKQHPEASNRELAQRLWDDTDLLLRHWLTA